jgi:hypothetical protein
MFQLHMIHIFITFSRQDLLARSSQAFLARRVMALCDLKAPGASLDSLKPQEKPSYIHD